MYGDQDNSEIYLGSSGNASREQLKNLSHELDCLGLPTININVDILQQLIGSINRLMSLYKKNLSQQQELQLQKTITENEKSSQQRLIENYNERLKSREAQVSKLKDSLRRKSMEINDLRATNKSINKDFDALRHLYHRKEDENSHLLIKLKLENSSLRERLGDDVGTHKSQDLLVIEALNKYKIKEGIYEETIKKLQDNNEQLLNEILNLKEEVVLTLQNGQSSDS